MKSHYFLFVVGALTAFFAGVLQDANFSGLSFSCAVVSVACFFAAFIAWMAE